MNDLISRLKSLGLIIPSSTLNSSPKTQTASFEDLYKGVWKSTSAGRVFFLENTIPYGSDFGKVNISNDFSPKTILNICGLFGNKPVLLAEIVFLDIETTNLSIGAGSFPFLVGLCHFAADGIQINLLFIENPNDEPALLAFLDEELSKFNVIGSYNGKSFDIPILKNRYIMNRMIPESIDKFHIDLLHLSRKIWKSRIKNCRLSDIEREILKYTRADEEIPGWLIPQIYFDYLDQKSPQLLEGVFYHNKIDVLSLAALFQYITIIIENHETMEEIEGIDLASVARIYQQLDKCDFAALFYKLGVERGISDSNLAIVYRNFGFLYKKQQEWEKAVKYWKLAAKSDDIVSCIELAKYYEHFKSSFKEALNWTNIAKKLLDQTYTELTEIRHKQDILHRKQRLLRRVKDSG